MGHEALRDQLLLAPQEWEEMPELAPWMKRMRVSRAQGIMSEERQQVPVTSILLPQVFGRWQIRYVQCKHLCEVELVLCTESSPFKTLVSSKAHKAGLTETAGVLSPQILEGLGFEFGEVAQITDDWEVHFDQLLDWLLWLDDDDDPVLGPQAPGWCALHIPDCRWPYCTPFRVDGLPPLRRLARRAGKVPLEGHESSHLVAASNDLARIWAAAQGVVTACHCVPRPQAASLQLPSLGPPQVRRGLGHAGRAHGAGAGAVGAAAAGATHPRPAAAGGGAPPQHHRPRLAARGESMDPWIQPVVPELPAQWLCQILQKQYQLVCLSCRIPSVMSPSPLVAACSSACAVK